jgi:hypothetical protein
MATADRTIAAGWFLAGALIAYLLLDRTTKIRVVEESTPQPRPHNEISLAEEIQALKNSRLAG